MGAYALIQKDDLKSCKWREAAAEIGFSLRIAPGSAAYLPLHLIRHTMRFGRPRAVIYRYLNDYPSITRTLARFLSEVFGVVLCLILRIRLVWICHNVDRESQAHHARISALRRHMFSRAANKILVMDPALVAHARQVFSKMQEKIDYTVFGPITGVRADEEAHKALVRDVKEFAARSDPQGGLSHVRIGLCAGIPDDKKPQFQDIPRLLDHAEEAGETLWAVVIGPVGRYMQVKNPAALERLQQDSRVLLRDEFVPLDERELSPYVDFYWRVCTDLSVPLGLYMAATCRKPILTREPGFLAEAVKAYHLGEVLRADFSDIEEGLSRLRSWDSENARRGD